MVRRFATLLVILGWLYPGVVSALGLGELTLHSYLNEPLVAEIDLLEVELLTADQIRIRLASRTDFENAGIERQYFLTSLKFEIKFDEDGKGHLRVTSSEKVREPFLDFLVEARWPQGRILREYTVLLDPPPFAGPESGVIATVSVPSAKPAEQQSTSSDPDPAATASKAREYGANASAFPAAGAEYLVQRNDTLWNIASTAKPQGASVHQTMLDIQRLNQQAFIGNNINQLKAGYVLQLPTSSEITSSDLEQAVAEIAEQEVRWQEQSDASDAIRLDGSEAQDRSAGADTGEEQGRLQIAGVDGESASSGSEGDLSARLESLDRARRDNTDLQSQISSMGEQVDTLTRLVELKDNQISALQNALADGTAEAGSGDTLDSQEGTVDDEGVIENLDEVIEAPAPVQAVQPVEASPGIVELAMDYLLYIVGALVILILGVAWLLRSKFKIGAMPKINIPKIRDKQDQAGSTTDVNDEFADVVLVADDGLIVDEFMEESGTASVTENLASFSAPDEEAYAAQFETGDALAEADIYIAYGRFPQAVDLLKAAISMEPLNTEYRIKLMEACVEMVERGEYQQQYADLRVIDDENALQRARALLDAVDGGEAWIDDLPAASLTSEEVAATKAAMAAAPAFVPEPETAPEIESEAAPEEEALLEELLDSDDSDDSDDSGLELMALDHEDYGNSAELELELDDEALSDFSADADTDELELELELELDDLADSGEAAEDLSLDLEESSEQAEPEDTLDLADEFSMAEPEPLEQVETAIESAPELGAAEEVSDSHDFNMEDFQTEDLALEAETDAETPEVPDDLELELPTESDSEDTSEEGLELDLGLDLETSSEDDADSSMEFGDLVLEDDTEDEISLEAVVEEIEDSASLDLDASDDEEEEGLVFATDGDEIATKLDLARAYLDMGDHDGARSILEEVQQDGNEGQQQEAQNLLDSID